MKDGWEIKKLKDLAVVINGGTPDTKISEYWDGGVLWITPKDMGQLTSKYVSATSRTISGIGLEKSSAKLIPNNSLILSTRAPIGYLAINTCAISTNQGCKGIVPSENLSSEYLYYFFSKSVKMLIDLGNGTTFKELSTSSLKNIDIPLPPLSEQKEIVALLDDVLSRIDKARENIKKNIENADELYQRTVIDLFSNTSEDWETKKLKEVCSIISDGTHHTPKYFDSGYIFLSSRNVTSGVIDWKDVKYIDETQHISMQKRVSPRIGDILLAKNGTTGVAALVDRDVDFDIYVSLALLRPLDFIDPTYLLYVINSPFAKRQFNARLKGMGVPNLHLEEIRKVTIQYPKSKEKQREIVEKISALLQIRNNLKDNYTKKLQALDELRNSVLEKAFRGELTGNSTAQSVAAK